MNHNFFLLCAVCLFAWSCQKKNTSIYQSSDLVIQKISPNTFLHISYLETASFGRVACNGLIYIRLVQRDH